MCNVMWKGKQVTKSDFSKLTFFSFEPDNLAGKQQVDEFLGEDKMWQSVSNQKTKTQQAFRARFGVEIPEDAQMTEMVSDSFHALKNKSVGSMEKGKRVKEAKEKLALQKHLMTEQQVLLDERIRRRELAESEVNQAELNEGRKLFQTEEEQAALREWLVENGSSDNEENLEYNNGLLLSQSGTFNAILKSVGNADINEFIDMDDGQFASNYAQKYQKLCRLATADVILEKYAEIEKTKSLSTEKRSITEVRAKIKFFQEMKAQYEDRMTLLSSPYYVLLRKADIKEYMGPDGGAKIEAIQDEKLKDYVKLFVKCQSSPLAMGKAEETESRYQAIYAKEASAQSKIDEKTANTFLETLETARTVNSEKKTQSKIVRISKKNIPVEELDEKTQEYIGMFDDLTEYFMQRPKKTEKEEEADDLSFVKTVKPALGTAVLNGITEEEFWKLEKDVLLGDIYEKGQIEGQKISPEVLAEIKPMIRTMIQERRRLEAVSKAGDFVNILSQDAAGCDFKNNVFRHTKAGKKMAEYVNYKGCYPVTCLVNQSPALYFETFQLIFYKLSEEGYSISKKYDKRTLDDKEVEKELETWRKEMQKHIEEERQEKGEANNEGQAPEYQYPVIKINGKPFRIFDPAQEKALQFLDKKSYQLDGEKGAELLKLMDEQEKLSKQRFYGQHVYEREGGFKSIVSIGYGHAYPIRMKKITDRIKELIGYKEPVKDNAPVNGNAPIDGWEVLDEKELA